MTGEELKAALLNEHPVIYQGIEYKKVSAVIYRKNEDGIRVSAELLDKNRHSVTIAASQHIRFKRLGEFDGGSV